jgi:hypothetical protein
MYPQNDNQYEEATIKKVSKENEGWSIERSDGWSFYVPADSPIEPKEGMTVRFYGKGIGYTVRGLYIDGQAVFYRSEEEDKAHHLVTTYGKDAAEWLSRWDEGKSVWSISMGGFGPGYEQAIQIAATEIVREMLDKKYDSKAWEESDKWEEDRNAIEDAMFKNERMIKLGLSGAQYGAAFNLATRIYIDGPISVMTTESIKDRHIQVSKSFPSV